MAVGISRESGESPADPVDGQAPKRRRLSIGQLVTAAESGMEEEPLQPQESPASADDCSQGLTDSVASSTGAMETTSLGRESSNRVKAHAASDPPLLVRPTSAATESQGSKPSLTLELAPKRSYFCRVCGLSLSSTSNRLRHERAKHKDHQPHADRGPSASPGQPAASVPSTMQASRKRTAANIYGTSTRHRTLPQPVVEAEESDEELVRFVAAHSNTTVRRAHRPIATLTSPVTSDEEKSDDSAHDMQCPSDSASPSTDGGSIDDGDVPGMHRLFTDEQLQEGCQPFLEWCCIPAISQFEFGVKARKVTSLTQLNPIKCNLKFVFTCLKNQGLIDAVDLHVFKRLDICRALFSALADRGCGSGRLHAIALLVKKVLIFLSSRQSTARREFLPPTLFESYLFVDATCSENSQRRKQESRNRALLGIQTTQQLLQSRAGYQPSQPFRVPATWSEGVSSNQASRSAPNSMLASSTAAAASVPPSSNELSTTELQQVAKFCLASLRKLMSTVSSTSIDAATQAVRDRYYMCLMVTAIFALGCAPRSQVVQQLEIGSSLQKKEDGLYWVTLLASQSKSNRPVLISLQSLTEPLDYYITIVRPRLLAPASADVPATHNFLFVNRDGSPRSEFRSCTRLVTQQCLGRMGGVNPHSFRAATVTTLWEAGASTSELTCLSDIMAHDVATQQRAYWKPERQQAAIRTSEKLKNLLLQAEQL